MDRDKASILSMNHMTDQTDLIRLTRQIEKAELDLIRVRTGPDDSPEQEDGMAVLFTGQWSDNFPRHLVLNQTLSPLEKVCWQAIRLSIISPEKPGATPRRDQLASMINCSAATVTAARTMLRATRWVTFCKTVRKHGQFVGDIYLFHDKPMSLESTLQIDMSYIQFLQNQTQSPNKRLRTVAGNILKEIDSIRSLQAPTELDLISAQLNSAKESPFNNHIKNFDTVTAGEKLSNFAKSPRHLQNFDSVKTHKSKPDGNHIKNFDSVESVEKSALTAERNFFPSRAHGSNNNYLDNKYISTRENEDDHSQIELFVADNPNPNPDANPEKTYTLALQHFPSLGTTCPEIKRYVITMFQFRENQLPVIERMLKKAPESHRTDILMQTIARNATYLHGWAARPLHNSIAFVGELIRRADADQFYPDEWALELKRALACNDAPMYFDNPDSSAFRKRQQDQSD